MSNSLKQHLVVIGLYLAFALVMSLPVVLSLNNELIGTGGDPWQVLWRFDERVEGVSQAIKDGGIVNAIKNEFGGGGTPRLVNLSVWPWLWAHLLLGEPLGYNIIWLLSFILSGYGMYLLVNYLLHKKEKGEKDEGVKKISSGEQERIKEKIMRQAPAFIAGLVYMLMPYHVAHAFGHFGAMQIQWIPLIILALYMLIDKLTILRAVVLALLITIQAWTEHHYMLWLGLFMVWLLFYSVRVKKKWKLRKKTVLYTLLIAVFLIIAVVIPYWPTIQLAIQPGSVIELGDEQLIRFSADPLSYFVPAPFHSIWGGLANSLFGQHFTGNAQESTLYLGLLPTLLILFYHQKIPRRQKTFWLATIMIFWLISLGPRLHLMGYVTRVFMPYGLIDNFPLLNVVRTVARAAVLVNVGWVILLAWVLKTQIKRTINVVVIILIVLVEFLFWPMPTMSFSMPLVYEQIKNMPGEAIIEIPVATNYLAASKALYGSKVHNKKLINNIALERALGAKTYQEIRSMPSLRQLLYLRTDHILEDRDDFFRQDMVETLFDVTNWLNVRQIIVHQDSLSEKQRNAITHLLEERAGLKRSIVEDVWLYEINTYEYGDGVFIARDDGWKKVAINTKKNEVSAEIHAQTAGLTIYNVNKKSVVVQLSWTMSAPDNEKLEIVTTATLKEDWNAINQTRTAQILIAPGKTEVKLINTKTGVIKIIEPVMNVLKNDQL